MQNLKATGSLNFYLIGYGFYVFIGKLKSMINSVFTCEASMKWLQLAWFKLSKEAREPASCLKVPKLLMSLG